MQILNIGSKSDDWRARRLSNFSADAFVLDGEKIASVEGFIQGTKFPEGDSIRVEAFRASGAEAKRLGKKAERQFVWWQGRTIVYGSTEHRGLIEKAIRAKFEQNKGAIDALLATDGMVLAHDLGYPDPINTSLPARVFCDLLAKIREEALPSDVHLCKEYRERNVHLDNTYGGPDTYSVTMKTEAGVDTLNIYMGFDGDGGYSSETVDIEINFCPFCGKKLK